MNSNSLVKKMKELKNVNNQETIIYCEDWSCGEIEWEFAKGNMQKIYTIIVPQTNKIVNVNKNKITMTNLNSNNLMAFINGTIKILYDDIINLESIINQMQNIDYIHFIGEGSLVNLFDLSFITIMSYGYKNKIKNSIINQYNNKSEVSFDEIQDYLKHQKFIKTLIISLLFIFTKNVKSVE
jgi:hypothetical protein